MADRIVLNTISYHGHGAIENIVPELTARGYKKAFVCSDPDLIKFGVTKKVTDLLDAANFAYSVYSEIKPNPTIANVQDGVAAFKAAEADCIVAIGGGSSMDTAKAIGVIINNPEFADVRSLEGVAPTKKHQVHGLDKQERERDQDCHKNHEQRHLITGNTGETTQSRNHGSASEAAPRPPNVRKQARTRFPAASAEFRRVRIEKS